MTHPNSIGAASYQPQVPSRSYVSSPPTSAPTHRPSNSISAYNSPAIAPPPQASIHPGPGPRRQSGYVEHHNQSYSGYMAPSSSRPPIDYPTPHGLGHNHPQPPLPTASHALERYDSRPAVPRSSSIRELNLVANGEEVRYWGDVMLGLTGLKNFGS
jgi:ubiquitin carboxyl-terminal hydrolase 8